MNGRIAEAQALAEKLGEDAAAAREALQNAQEQYKQGIMGMIDWMLGKEGLSKIQKQDLESARSILQAASEEKITKWSGGADHPFPADREDSVIFIGDEKDATSLDNVRRAVEVMKKINELRAADDNYAGLRDKPATTNFHFLATAEAGAMRGAALMRHSQLTTSCEDLAFGYSDPTVGWYNEEKADFDAIKESLGITKITGLDDIRRIEREAEKRGIVVGHYTNLFWESDQIMGVGYTQYGKRFKNTFCYNAGKTSSYTNDEYGRGRHAYTVGEMEALLDSYCESIDRDRLSAAAEMAEQALLDAEKEAELLQAGREDAVSSLISEAGKALQQKESELTEVGTRAEEAGRGAVQAAEALGKAELAKEAAKNSLDSAAGRLDAAGTAVKNAADRASMAEEARSIAQEAADRLSDALRKAVEVRDGAIAVLAGKKEALEEANRRLADAAAQYAEAVARTAELTSGATLEKLRAAKEAAEETLRNALDLLETREAALADAEGRVSTAQAALSEAGDRQKAAAERLQEAQERFRRSNEHVDALSQELELLKEAFAPVREAAGNLARKYEELKAGRDRLAEASEAADRAQAGLESAKSAREAAADHLLRAQALSLEEALVKDIEDEEFTYLNPFVRALRDAGKDLAALRARMKEAADNLSARQESNSRAQKRYIEALAEQAIREQEAARMEAASRRAEAVQEGGKETEALSAADGTEAVKDADDTEAVRTAGFIGTRTGKTGTGAETGDRSPLGFVISEMAAAAGFMALLLRRRKEDRNS